MTYRANDQTIRALPVTPVNNQVDDADDVSLWPSNSIRTRTRFPETWLWENLLVNGYFHVLVSVSSIFRLTFGDWWGVQGMAVKGEWFRCGAGTNGFCHCVPLARLWMRESFCISVFTCIRTSSLPSAIFSLVVPRMERSLWFFSDANLQRVSCLVNV